MQKLLNMHLKTSLQPQFVLAQRWPTQIPYTRFKTHDWLCGFFKWYSLLYHSESIDKLIKVNHKWPTKLGVIATFYGACYIQYVQMQIVDITKGVLFLPLSVVWDVCCLAVCISVHGIDAQLLVHVVCGLHVCTGCHQYSCIVTLPQVSMYSCYAFTVNIRWMLNKWLPVLQYRTLHLCCNFKLTEWKWCVTERTSDSTDFNSNSCQNLKEQKSSQINNVKYTNYCRLTM